MNIRQDKILELLKTKKQISIQQLCDTLLYSRSTIRRDLIILQEMELVKREKGNVRLLVSNSKEKHFKVRNRENIDKKRLICEAAIDFIADGMSIFLDASSTVLQICPLLVNYKDITVVTNSIEIAYALIYNSSVEVFMAGGYVREGTSAVVGEPAMEYIKQFRLDLCISSCKGVDEEGFYEPSLQQSIVKQHMIANAETNIMLCDSTKFESRYKFNLAHYEQIDYLITDRQPSQRICVAAGCDNCEIIAINSNE